MKKYLLTAMMSVAIAVLFLTISPAARGELTPEQQSIMAAIAQGQQIESWPGLSDPALGALESRAEAYLANFQQHHLRNGLSVDVQFATPERIKVEKLDGIGDSATWTAHYLASLACKYAATKNPATLSDIHKVLDGLELLAKVTGKPGFIARFAGPSGDPAFQRYYSVYGDGADPKRPGFGTMAFPGAPGFTNWVWLGDTSQDVYIAVNFGLAVTYRLAESNPIRTRIRSLTESILDRLDQDRWIIIDAHQHRSRWQLSPLALAALTATGAAVNPEKYGAWHSQRAVAILEGPPPEICKYCSYFSNNLKFASYYTLAILEADPQKHARYQRLIAEMWRTSHDHLNGYFAALYMTATGDTANLTARATLEGTLADFPPPPRRDFPTDNRQRKTIETKSANGKTWANYALLVHDRVPSDFLWQRSPCELKGGTTELLEYPGIDFLLPYWMGRQCGALSPRRNRN